MSFQLGPHSTTAVHAIHVAVHAGRRVRSGTTDGSKHDDAWCGTSSSETACWATSVDQSVVFFFSHPIMVNFGTIMSPHDSY